MFLSKTINFYDKYWDKALKNSHELIGNISVVKIIDEIDSVELGWVIGRKWWGNGYTAEAAERLLEFFFTEVSVNRICAGHDIDNPNSGRVMQKIGIYFVKVLKLLAKLSLKNITISILHFFHGTPFAIYFFSAYPCICTDTDIVGLFFLHFF